MLSDAIRCPICEYAFLLQGERNDEFECLLCGAEFVLTLAIKPTYEPVWYLHPADDDPYP